MFEGASANLAIARYLQQEAAAICLKGDKVEVCRLTELAKQEPSATLESALMHQQASPEKVRLLVPSAFSVASDETVRLKMIRLAMSNGCDMSQG